MSKKSVEQDLLSQSPLFQGLSKEHFAKILKLCKVQKYKTGQTIIEENSVGKGLYMLAKGSVEVFLPESHAKGSRGSKMHLNTLKQGSFFGEYSLIDEQKSTANIEALSPVRIYFLPAIDFDLLVEEDDLIGKLLYRNILSILVERLKLKDQQVDVIFYR